MVMGFWDSVPRQPFQYLNFSFCEAHTLEGVAPVLYLSSRLFSEMAPSQLFMSPSVFLPIHPSTHPPVHYPSIYPSPIHPPSIPCGFMLFIITYFSVMSFIAPCTPWQSPSHHSLCLLLFQDWLWLTVSTLFLRVFSIINLLGCQCNCNIISNKYCFLKFFIVYNLTDYVCIP